MIRHEKEWIRERPMQGAGGWYVARRDLDSWRHWKKIDGLEKLRVEKEFEAPAFSHTAANAQVAWREVRARRRSRMTLGHTPEDCDSEGEAEERWWWSSGARTCTEKEEGRRRGQG